MHQGTITVDWDHKGGMVISYPGGKLETASNKKDALAKVKRWCQEQTEIVHKVTGQVTIGSARLDWLNGTNLP